jgi:hypothetical protein
MIYLTGDTHNSFRRFTKKSYYRRKFDFNENDYVIVCGDFGLLWRDDAELRYNLKWLSSLPFTILWVSGNHENYDLIEQYDLEEWNGGKVRKMASNIILLERGQIFSIEGHTFFTFGGASCHDVQGGILDPADPDYDLKKKKVSRSGIPYRVKGISWWEQELPTEAEMQEGLKNLESVNYKVDYVITHCASDRIQEKLDGILHRIYGKYGDYKSDVLTQYFDVLEDKLVYKHWYFGHYHVNESVDNKHTVLYDYVIRLN